MSYKATYGTVNTIRMCILAGHAEDAKDLLGGEIELDEAYFGGRRKGNRGRGAAEGSRLRHPGKRRPGPCECRAQCHGGNPSGSHGQEGPQGDLWFTDKFKSYDSLMFCGYRHLKGGPRQVFLFRQGVHQRHGGILELGKALHQASWRLQGVLPSLFERAGVQV